MAQNHGFYPNALKGKPKKISVAPSLGYANFGPMKALGTTHLCIDPVTALVLSCKVPIVHRMDLNLRSNIMKKIR